MQVRDRSKSAGVAEMFHNKRGQSETSDRRVPASKTDALEESRTRFEQKMRAYDGEGFFRVMTSSDMVFYFQRVAKEADTPYFIGNFVKDVGVFRTLNKKLDASSICVMIEFLFLSGQDYVKCPTPSVLASAFGNRILKDALLWVKNEYKPEPSREWKKAENKTDAKIGEW